MVPNISIGGGARSSASGSQYDGYDLKSAMQEEIADQTFQFPSSELARILSPKSLKVGVEACGRLTPIKDYICKVDDDAFDNALGRVVAKLQPFTSKAPGSSEASIYSCLASFLTKCVTECHLSLDNWKGFPESSRRWYEDLEFAVGAPAVEGIEGAADLKPDIVAAKGISKHGLMRERFYWDPPVDKRNQRILIPLEVEKDWKDLVPQAAAYARGLFCASPTRMFALVLGFNHGSNELRFLVFHCGGLAASLPYDIGKADGLKEVARLFLTLTLWTTAAEAGFVTCYNETTYLLPVDEKGENHVSATMEAVFFRSPRIRGRMTRVILLRLPPPKDAASADSQPPVEEPRELFELPGGLRRTTGIATVGGEPRPLTAKPTAGSKYPLTEEATPFSEGSKQSQEIPLDKGPDTRLEYIPPFEIVRGSDDPLLSTLTGTVVVKVSWSGINRRDSEAKMFRDRNGRFGVMPHVCSYEVAGKGGEVISNILFFPEKDDINQYHWPIFVTTPPNTLDIRTYRQTIFASRGELFLQAESPRKLSRAFAHALLGWLSVYTSGYLHRDLNFGNVLTISEAKKRFEIPKEFFDGLPEEAAEGIKEQCKEVETLVAELGISNEHSAVITGGDLSISWRTYSEDASRAAESGTPEFMSRALSWDRGEHLHSPVDDLESFFWVAFWSVLFNKEGGPPTEAEKIIMDDLNSGNRSDALDRFFHLLLKDGGNATKRFKVFLWDWWKQVWARGLSWSKEVVWSAPDDAGKEYYLPYFHRYALQGVLDVLGALHKHWNGEINWESWTAPTQST